LQQRQFNFDKYGDLMNDLIFVIASLAFFALSAGFIVALDKI
jgi:hypothetical protein